MTTPEKPGVLPASVDLIADFDLPVRNQGATNKSAACAMAASMDVMAARGGYGIKKDEPHHSAKGPSILDAQPGWEPLFPACIHALERELPRQWMWIAGGGFPPVLAKWNPHQDNGHRRFYLGDNDWMEPIYVTHIMRIVPPSLPNQGVGYGQ